MDNLSGTTITQKKKKKFALSVNKQEHEWLQENYCMDLSDFEFQFTSSMLTSQLPLKRKSGETETHEDVKKRKEDLFMESFSCFEDTQTLLSNVKIDTNLNLEGTRKYFSEDLEGINVSSSVTLGVIKMNSSGNREGIKMNSSGNREGIKMNSSGNREEIKMNSSGNREGIKMNSSGNREGIKMNSSGNGEGTKQYLSEEMNVNSKGTKKYLSEEMNVNIKGTKKYSSEEFNENIKGTRKGEHKVNLEGTKKHLSEGQNENYERTNKYLSKGQNENLQRTNKYLSNGQNENVERTNKYLSEELNENIEGTRKYLSVGETKNLERTKLYFSEGQNKNIEVTKKCFSTGDLNITNKYSNKGINKNLDGAKKILNITPAGTKRHLTEVDVNVDFKQPEKLCEETMNAFGDDFFMPITQELTNAKINFKATNKLSCNPRNEDERDRSNKLSDNKTSEIENKDMINNTFDEMFLPITQALTNGKIDAHADVVKIEKLGDNVQKGGSDNMKNEDGKENGNVKAKPELMWIEGAKQSSKKVVGNASTEHGKAMFINNTFDEEIFLPVTQELLGNKMSAVDEQKASTSHEEDRTTKQVEINQDSDKNKIRSYEDALKKINVGNEIKGLNKVLELAEQSIRLGDDNPWPDDSLLASALINMTVEGPKSIGSFIKEALIENARRNLSPEKLVNTTIKEDEHVFRNYGQFYGLPDIVKDLIKQYKGIDKLYEWQDECLNLPAVNDRKNLVYALPTSGGKTLVAEILILREILCRRKNVIFVLPFVAIVQEKVWALSSFAVALEFLIEEYAGGKGNYPPRKRRRKNSVYIATIEKALGLMNSLIELNRTDEIGLIVVDELHLVGDRHRGSVLEEFLTKVKYVKDKIQVVGMSATIGNLKEICNFLDADVYSRDFRPVELVEYVKCGDEIARVDLNAPSEDEILVFERKVDYQYTKGIQKLDPDHLGGLVMEVIPNGSCLIFCRSKQNCENVAMLLCKILPRSVKEHRAAERETIKKVLKEEGGSLCKVLKVSIAFGIAYHHSGLTAEERRVIEEGFRQGAISIICCTSTLAAGVNLPAQRVIIRNPYIGRDFINLSRYKQMVGRAGRAGFGEKGESIVICTPQELPRVRDMFKSPMDVALSAMHENDERGLQQFILSCISLKLAHTKVELERIISETLLSIQKDKLEVNLKNLTRAVIKNLFKKGALQVEGQPNPIHAGMNVTLDTTIDSTGLNNSKSESKTLVTVTNDTPLEISKMGRAAIKGGLDLSRAHMLFEDLLQAQYSLVLFTGLHLMYLVTPYDISEQITPTKAHYYTLYSQLCPRELQTANVLGLTEAVAAKMLNNKRITEVPERVLNRFYVTLMLYDLWNEMPLYDVAAKYEVNRGLIQNLMTAAATFASNVFHFCEELEEFWAFSLLLKGMSDRLSHCCVKELVPLMSLPSVKQNRAKQLFQAGYKTLQSIAKANPNDLIEKIEYMSRKLANQLIAAAKLFLLEKVENLREEAEDVLEGVNI